MFRNPSQTQMDFNLRKTLCLTASCIALLLTSCATDRGDAPAPAESHQTLSQRLSDTGGYKVDSEGNWKPRNNKRSSFESEGASQFSKSKTAKLNGKTDYKTGEFAKKSWWGNKDYGRKAYSGNTDGSRFQKNSRLDGIGARESGGAADLPDPYQTGNYATSSANESSQSNIDRPADAETDERRNVFQQPKIIDWRQQRTLSLDQSKGILGR